MGCSLDVPLGKDDSVGLSPLCLRASKCSYNFTSMEALGDTSKHETQNKICQNSILYLSVRCFNHGAHTPTSCTWNVVLQRSPQPPASPHQTTKPFAPFKLPRCVPRTAAADGKSNAIRLFLKHKKELDASTGKINGKAWFLKHTAKAHQLDFSNTMLKLPKNKLEKSTGGSLLFPMFPPWGWIWMDAFFSETEFPENRKDKLKDLTPRMLGVTSGQRWLKEQLYIINYIDMVWV